MCGRYASSRSPGDLVIEFEIEENELDPVAPAAGSAPPTDAPGQWAPAQYNIAPTATVPIVLERLSEPEPVTDESDADALKPVPARAVRRLRPLTWGLVPSWSKDRTGGARMINARAESLLEKPAFRKAALTRRCLVPADGWYEWQVSPSERDQKGKPRKQPFFIHPADGAGLAFAGIYEFWRDSNLHADDPQAWLVTFAVITTEAEPGLDVIHDRMPLVLPAERWDAWLDPRLRDQDDVRALIERPPPGRFAAVPVTTRVNSVRNDGPELLEPAPADQLVGVVDPATGELIGGRIERLAEPLF
jgi:putative SOS response-associated peptidase YedK